MKTTLNAIRKHKPCADGWEKLLSYLGKTKADNKPLLITTILDSNGLEDAIWCLRAVDGYDREIRLYSIWCARQVQYFLTDPRILDALDVSERYANGEATKEELLIASDSAKSAVAGTTAYVARATCAATYAARATADASAYAAAVIAARAAADAAGDAAHQEMRSRQETELRRMCEGD